MMSSKTFDALVAQLPGHSLSTPKYPGRMPDRRVVQAGQVVLYTGKISGGPQHGSRGVVKRAMRRKALVSLECSGIWHIPYHLLSLPNVA